MGRVILVVDDSMLIRHTVCRFLEERGFVVESATNGAEALDVLSAITPDLIITDLSMPKLDGSGLITEFKKRPDHRATPIIVLAARQSTKEPINEARADAMIYKDIDIAEQLDAALLKVLLPEQAAVIR